MPLLTELRENVMTRFYNDVAPTALVLRDVLTASPDHGERRR